MKFPILPVGTKVISKETGVEGVVVENPNKYAELSVAWDPLKTISFYGKRHVERYGGVIKIKDDVEE